MLSSHVLVAYRESLLTWQLAGLEMWYVTDFGFIFCNTLCLKFQHALGNANYFKKCLTAA